MPAAPDRPLLRLSRFDGTTFHPVEENSVTAPFVHVFVHGWQPGYWLQERLHALGDQVDALPAWDPRLLDASGRTLSSYYVHLLEALADLGDDHCVLHYSWLDESATESNLLLAFRSRQATQANGRRLAVALQMALKTASGAQLHLIGHSHGSAVAVHAAAALSRPPAQVTLLDPPENRLARLSGAATLIDVVLPRISPGRSPGRPFVDSYSSVFGRPYHRKPGLASVVDVVLAAGPAAPQGLVETVNRVHLYGVDWYARSVREPEHGVGYGWSPLRGATVRNLMPAYQSLLPYRPMSLTHWPDPPRVDLRRGVRSTRPVALELELSATFPVAAGVVNLQGTDGLLEFDLEVTGGDGSEQVQIDLDTVTVFVARTGFPVPERGRYVVLADGSAGEHLLTARLSGASGSPGSPGSPDEQPRVRVTGIRIVSWADARPGFTLKRAASTTFGAGMVTGGAGAVALLAVGAGLRRGLRALLR
ncbi:hypothetical protein [Kineosporia succinea]|uniref:Alpha/beta hydrolase family protein n=1 Tax=Kineosporia succinea TaxID=84632 RepID=A0ABT9PCS4_9ACTN|nr:hypothetical protein [Kineosporia succinea]MDP9830493.1 hypothetical protein [Kineosporia succinea]